MHSILVDANLPRCVTQTISSHGWRAIDVRDIGLASASDEVIARHAQAHNLAIMTRDFDFADIRNYPPSAYHGIVVLDLPTTFTARQVDAVVRRWLRQSHVTETISRSLVIVSAQRVRIRRA